ncbi:hypothetical protein E1B28_010120 [Marasmius oreades]|uniref:Uncharacterized protein n=1 Tax=Marasmius oreades TaxID=181124 RepID=A0A9P7RXY5_9AGAR|nr:uncharacterized protein E1B28_010120 [Marasmius oreades]KAG7091063.1 hypothetical protein E1B28_010120 [Marasmius oreades]
MNRIKRVFKRKNSVSESQERPEHEDSHDEDSCAQIPTSSPSKLKRAVKTSDISFPATQFGPVLPCTHTKSYSVGGNETEAPLSDVNYLTRPRTPPPMYLDQFFLDLFPAPPTHGQVKEIETYALAFPSEPRMADNRILVYPPHEELPPLLPKLEHMVEQQRLKRRTATSSVSSLKKRELLLSNATAKKRKFVVSESVPSVKREPLARNYANTNAGHVKTALPPSSLLFNKPLPPIPSHSPPPSKSLPRSSITPPNLRNKTSFFIDRAVTRPRTNSTHSLGASVRLNTTPVAQLGKVTTGKGLIPHPKLGCVCFRRIPDVPQNVGIYDRDNLLLEEPEEVDKPRNKQCRCAVLIDETGNIAGRVDHYLPTCPKYTDGQYA